MLEVAVNHDPGGYMATDNLIIVTVASSEVNRVLTGSETKFREICSIR